jgi:hypothetical protein
LKAAPCKRKFGTERDSVRKSIYGNTFLQAQARSQIFCRLSSAHVGISRRKHLKNLNKVTTSSILQVCMCASVCVYFMYVCVYCSMACMIPIHCAQTHTHSLSHVCAQKRSLLKACGKVLAARYGTVTELRWVGPVPITCSIVLFILHSLKKSNPALLNQGTYGTV